MAEDGEASEFQGVEDELATLLRYGYGVERGDLSLSTDQRKASDRNAQLVLAQIAGALPFEPDRRRRQLRRRWVLGAAAAAVVAVVAVATAVPFGPAPPSAYAATPPPIDIEGVDPSTYPLHGTSPDARLEELARRAEAQPGSNAAGPIQRVESSAWWLNTEQTAGGPQSELVPVDVQRYVLPGGRIRIREERGAPITTEGDLGEQAAGPVASDETFPLDTSNPMERPMELPRDVGALRQVLLGPEPAECANTEAYCITRALRSLNLTFVLDPDLQAALIRSLRGEDDIRYAGPGRDRLGREVKVFVVDDPDRAHQHLVLFEASTGAWVGDETVLTRSIPDVDVEPPAVIEFNAITNRSLIAREDLPSGATTTP